MRTWLIFLHLRITILKKHMSLSEANINSMLCPNWVERNRLISNYNLISISPSNKFPTMPPRLPYEASRPPRMPIFSNWYPYRAFADWPSECQELRDSASKRITLSPPARRAKRRSNKHRLIRDRERSYWAAVEMKPDVLEIYWETMRRVETRRGRRNRQCWRFEWYVEYKC